MLLRAALEREPFARRVCLGWLRVIQEFAQVKKVLLRSGALRQINLAPLGYEFGNGHVLFQNLCAEE